MSGYCKQNRDNFTSPSTFTTNGLHSSCQLWRCGADVGLHPASPVSYKQNDSKIFIFRIVFTLLFCTESWLKSPQTWVYFFQLWNMRGGSTHKRERKTHKINILHTGNIFRPQETFTAHKKHFAYKKHFSHTRKVLHTRNIFRTQETSFTHKKQTFFTCAKSFLCVKCFLCVKDCHVFPPISLDVFYTRKLRSSKNN